MVDGYLGFGFQMSFSSSTTAERGDGHLDVQHVGYGRGIFSAMCCFAVSKAREWYEGGSYNSMLYPIHPSSSSRKALPSMSTPYHHTLRLCKLIVTEEFLRSPFTSIDKVVR